MSERFRDKPRWRLTPEEREAIAAAPVTVTNRELERRYGVCHTTVLKYRERIDRRRLPQQPERAALSREAIRKGIAIRIANEPSRRLAAMARAEPDAALTLAELHEVLYRHLPPLVAMSERQRQRAKYNLFHALRAARRLLAPGWLARDPATGRYTMAPRAPENA